MMMGPNLRRAQAATINERRGRRIRKVVSLQLALQSAIAAIVFVGAAHADNTDKAAVPAHDLQAKMTYCENCHGSSAQGFHGYYPIPRLAGQQTEYLKNQLQAFVEHRRTNNVMFNVAHVLSPAMLTALATSFHDLNPKPLGGGPKELVSTGKKIYEEGIPSADVPPCASCHGPEAKGDGEFPRLAGQLHDYIFNKLTNWSKERGQDPQKPDASAIMQPIAHSLTEQQVKAVATYLNYLE
ncbi:MAG: c-type cytochrome [Xanthobacteraceae bacterium]|jgi:cytochrome c553